MSEQLSGTPSVNSARVPPTESARRPRRLRRALLWTLIPLAALIVLLVIADVVTRAIVEQRVAASIEHDLPGTVKADVSVHLGGVSVLQQLLAGEFESVELDAPNATVNGAPLSAKVQAENVPTDFSKPIGTATGTLTISQSSLNTLVTIPGATGDITLNKGTIGYDGKIDLLGLPVDYTVTATPKAEGKTVLLYPEKASISAGNGDVNLTHLLQSIADNGPFPVCAAQYLPDGVTVSDIRIDTGKATVVLTATGVVLGEEFLHSKGSCT